MKLVRWIAMLAAVLTATSAYGQDVTTSGTKPVPTASGAAISGTQPIKIGLIGGASSDTTRWVIPITSDGTGVKISDNARDRDNVLTQMLFTGTMYDDSTKFCADSTATPIDVHAYRNLKLVFFISPQDSSASGAQRWFRFGLQLRECVNGITDSTGSASEYGYAHSLYGSAIGTTPSADTVSVGQITPPTLFQVASDEQEIIVDQHRAMVVPAGQINPNLPAGGIAYMIQWFGSPHQFMKLNIRLRMLKTLGATSLRAKYTVWLLGWS
jgi:hypothetical protein